MGLYYIYYGSWYSIAIDLSKLPDCMLCESCAEVCPAGLIEIDLNIMSLKI